jgi:transcriptional regulator with XRE-family HTH domain
MIGERLARAIRTGKLTQRELAHATGLDEGMISRLVHGTRTASFPTIDKILDALGMEVVFRPLRRTRKGE